MSFLQVVSKREIGFPGSTLQNILDVDLLMFLNEQIWLFSYILHWYFFFAKASD